MVYTRHFLGLIVLLFSLNIQDTSATDGFIFTMPKVLRHGELSEFCVTVYGPPEGSMAVTLALFDRSDPNFKITVNDVYPNGLQTCNNFTVPKPGDYEMLLYNATTILHDSIEITVEDHNLVTLVQSDKPMYKPGQTVKFRVLTFKSDQKPRMGMIEAIYIKNPSETRVKQYLNIDSKGLASLEFQLTKEAELGKWEILVFLNETISTKPDGVGGFEVKEYVLPRFEVEVKHPAYILANDDFVDVEVCATYTYGKPVVGFLDLTMCFSSYLSSPFPCFHQVVSISGCYNVSVNVTEMQGPDFYPFYGLELNTTATVTEAGTGAMVNASKNGPGMTTEPLKITLEDYTNGFFKPHLPFYGKAIVTKPDGTPAPGENIRIRATDYKNDITYSGNFTSDESGIVMYSLCGAFTEKTSRISIDAVAFDYNQDIGESHRGMYTPRKFQEIRQWFSPSLTYIDIPKTESNHKCGDSLTLSIPFTTRAKTNTDFKYQIMARRKIITTGNVFYKYNVSYPGGNLLQPPSNICLERIEKETSSTPPTLEPIPVEESTPPLPPELEEPPIPGKEVIGEDLDFEGLLGASETDIMPGFPGIVPDLNLEGDFEEPIVRSEVLSDTVSNFLLDIPISTVMAPKFTLLIYHILPDGEVVADSMEYNVQPCFDNEVSMSFNSSTALPGENVNIHLEAAPGSICGLGIVDKSVNVLGGNHQITSEKIFKVLEEYNTPKWMNPYFDDTYCEDRIKKLRVMEPKGEEGSFWHYESNYVDALQAFQSSGFITLTDLKLQTRPCKRTYPIFYASVAQFPQEPGLVPGAPGGGSPNGRGPIAMTESIKGKAKKRTQDIRHHFPETWLWDLTVVGVDGSEDLIQTAPHTVTSWVGNAVCMNSEKGVGVSPIETITTFQPFFIHLQLPYSAVRDERLPLMINIYNYVQKCLYVQLALETSESLKVDNAILITQPLCVCGGESVTKKLYVTPQDIGRLPITLKAEVVPGSCNNETDMDENYIGLSDGVQRKLFVKAEGVMKEYTHTSYMCLEGDRKDVENLILPLPETIVKNSERGEVRIIGDIMGPALTNLHNLVRMPTGCGEQNMVGFTPNIFALKYLTSTSRSTEEIHTDAVKYMEIGYQRELKYRHSDGSYSAFGERDAQGSVWLTAFVVKSFAQARPYIYIDDMDMEISLTFLRRSQLENGCFRETGKVFSSYMMGGLGRKKSLTSLTAYVLIALLKANVNSTEKVITNGFRCMKKDFRREKQRMDTYSLALLAYSHTLYNPESRMCREVMRVLNGKAKRGASTKYWSRDGSKPKTPPYAYYHSAPSAEVEMTAYALLAHLEFYGSLAVPRTHAIAMWLSQQRNPYGGFSSTQDTVVGLNALAEFAELTYRSEPTELNVTIEGSNFRGDFEVSEAKNTLLLLQTVQIPTIPNTVSISAQGEGCVLIQANVRFNKQSQDLTKEKHGLHLKVKPRLYQHNIDRCDRRTIQIHVGRRGRHRHSKGMSLLTVRMVTGWTPIQDSLTKILSLSPTLGIQRHEYNEEEGLLTFYLDDLKRKPIQINLDVEQDQNMRVSNPKSAEVEVFQYYETDVKYGQSYNLKTICGTKQEIPRNINITEFEEFPFVQMRIDSDGPPRIPVPAPLNRNQELACPLCVESASEVENLASLFCNSTSVYKAIAGRGPKKSYPIKLKVDAKATKKARNLNEFTAYTLPEGCNCALLEPPVTRVYIFSSRPLEYKNLLLDADSAIIKSYRKLDKQLKRLKRTCPSS